MANLLPPLPVGIVPGSGYWNDWYEKLRTMINSVVVNGISWALVSGKPTTVAGFGITDAVTLTGAETITNKTMSGPSVTVTGDVTAGSGTLIKSSVSLTNGAGGAAGTLLNAPVAGNPTKWIKIIDNGVTRYIPSW